MLILLLILLLLSNALTTRKDKSTLLSRTVITVLIFFLIKYPLILGTQLICPKLIPLIIAFACSINHIWVNIIEGEQIKLSRVSLTFFFCLTLSFIICFIPTLDSTREILIITQPFLVSWLGLTNLTLAIPIHQFILYADNANDGYASSSAYDSDKSSSETSSINSKEERLQLGAIFNGLSYNKVDSIYRKINIIISDQINHPDRDQFKTTTVFVADVLEHPSISGERLNTERILRKVYHITNHRYDSAREGSVLAMVSIEPSFSINYCTPMKKLSELLNKGDQQD